MSHLSVSSGARASSGLSSVSTTVPVSWGGIRAPPADEAGLPKHHPRGVAAEAEAESAIRCTTSTTTSTTTSSSFWIDGGKDEERRDDAGDDDMTTNETLGVDADDGGDDDHDDINSDGNDDNDEADNEDDAFTVFLGNPTRWGLTARAFLTSSDADVIGLVETHVDHRRLLEIESLKTKGRVSFWSPATRADEASSSDSLREITAGL